MNKWQFWLLTAIATMLVLLSIGFSFHSELPKNYFAISWISAVLLATLITLFHHLYAINNLHIDNLSRLNEIEEELWQMKMAVDKSRGAFYIHNAEGKVLYANEYACNSLGYRRDELVGMYPWQFDPDFTPNAWQLAWNTLKKAGTLVMETRHRHKNGTTFPVEVSAHYLIHNDQELDFVLVQNITERKRIIETLVHREAQLRQKERAQRALLDNFPFEVWMKDKESRFLAVNQAFADAFDFEDANQLIGKSDFDVSAPDLAEIYSADDRDVMNKRKKKTVEKETEVHGMHKWVEIYKAPILDDNGEVFGTVGFTRDITERKNAETRMQMLAHHDQLTKLPNRTLLTDRASQAIADAKRKKSMLAILFLDLDKFKPVNDKLGHNIGDLLLISIAARLLECAKRASDTTSRIGGDEFVILLSRIQEKQDVIVVAEKILHTICQPFIIEGHTIHISTSIGIALYPEHADNLDDMLKHADSAMYQAKKNGKNCYQFYQAEQ